ncbi:MAG TPA: malonate decarboxylase holo-[acyl-carrier-protein] synthase [Casimicrobiaceae bacterium]|nr:malonate decarboxylase holo-[acyl-carrier-protein] synthase [Casimicrobiaceae bacterium]
MAPTDLPRHTLVWVDAAAAPMDSGMRAWFVRGRPAVVARRANDDRADKVRVGIALPPSEGGMRLGGTFSASAITRWREPLTLAEIYFHAPQEWQEGLRDLAIIGRGLWMKPRVYGSFAWQALTLENYLNASSDIDLVWQLASKAQADPLVAALSNWEMRTARRVDGEMIFGAHRAVCWREWAQTTSRVLVKTIDAVKLLPRAELASLLL